VTGHFAKRARSVPYHPAASGSPGKRRRCGHASVQADRERQGRETWVDTGQSAYPDSWVHAVRPWPGALFGQLITVAGFAQGDRTAAASALEEATTIAERTGQSDALGLNFGPTNMAFWRVSMEADGHDPGRAVEIARTLNPKLVTATSRQAALYIDYARTLSNIGKNTEAVRVRLIAERLAPQRVRRSPIVAETLRGALERARRGTGWAQLRGLCERVGIQP
jgi:hypothetical protein